MRAERIQAVIPCPQGPPRTPGVHASGLIRAMAVQYGLLDKKWMADEMKLIEVEGDGESFWANLDDASRVRMSIGLAWEDWYLGQLPHVIHQPGELYIAGIYTTPDGQSLEYLVVERHQKAVIALHEIKTTSKSTNTVGDLNVPNPKNWMWLTQIKILCAAAHTLIAYLHILYLYGDYSRPFQPALHVWRLEFEPHETMDALRLVSEFRDAHT